jgi:flagellar motility protein MotE (MotC chaperone)
MNRWVRELRLIPIVLFATISLFALKAIGLLIDGHYALYQAPSGNPNKLNITGSVPQDQAAAPAKSASKQVDQQSGKQSWAQQMFNFPDTTGAVGAAKSDAAPAPPKEASPSKPEEPKAESGSAQVPLEGGRPQSAAEIVILERLRERRNELDARMKEVEMRESLIKAAEKRIEERLLELKELESRFNDSIQQRDESEAARFKNVITMYESMKAKDAAKIFDRLDMKILVEVATQINPRRMSDILAQMTPQTAERLTVELAARSAVKDKVTELPKIEGKPTN